MNNPLVVRNILLYFARGLVAKRKRNTRLKVRVLRNHDGHASSWAGRTNVVSGSVGFWLKLSLLKLKICKLSRKLLCDFMGL